jgi:hypothetical protein
MEAITKLQRFSVRLFTVSPFYTIAAVIWVSLLSDINSSDNFGVHYKALLAGYPILMIVNGIMLFSFSILLIAIFISMLFALNSLIQKTLRFRWLRAIVPPLFVLIAIIFTASLLLYTPPDHYLVLIFFAVLAFFFTQLHRYSVETHEINDLRFIFVPTALASLAMTILFFLAMAWLVIFLTDSASASQPWLSITTLFFMLATVLIMGITTGLAALELVRSFPFWRTKNN